MDYKKILLYVAVALVGIYLYNAWIQKFPAQDVTQGTTQSVPDTKSQSSSSQSFAPPTYSPHSKQQSKEKTKTHATSSSLGEIIHVKTDTLAIEINLNGGDIINSQLLKYPKSLNTPSVFVELQNKNPAKLYLAQSGITNTSLNGGTSPIKFNAVQSTYVMPSGQNKLQVVLKGKTKNGLLVSKTYSFQRNRYLIDLTQSVKNIGNKAWAGSYYQQIIRRDFVVKQAAHMRSYTGVSYSTPQIPYEKLKLKTIASDGFKKNIKDGWIAMQQPYFLTAWIPERNKSFHYYAHTSTPTQGDLSHLIYTMGYVSPEVTVAPHATSTQKARIFIGPEVSSRLKQAAPGLKYTIDYGWLAPISIFLFWIMMKIDFVVGNWGWTIILVTLLIKLVLYYPSALSYRSMARMRSVAPRLKALKERYGDDKQAISKATMEIYKEEKVNPVGGCLPMLVQVPIFFALYYVLLESVQLRQAPFIFWIHDLSAKDPYYILPVLMGISMFVQQRLNPAPPDPTQAKVMMFMPLIFTVVFLNFPVGLVLYWLTNNCVSILQQWYIMKTFDAKADERKRKKKKKKR